MLAPNTQHPVRLPVYTNDLRLGISLPESPLLFAHIGAHGSDSPEPGFPDSTPGVLQWIRLPTSTTVDSLPQLQNELRLCIGEGSGDTL